MQIQASLASLGISLLVLTAIATTQVAVSNSITISGPGVPHFDYILTILFENEGLNQTYGSHCTGNCTYITQLANTYSLAKNYSSLGNPSLPNYLALTSGGNYDRVPFDMDCSPLSTGCQISAPNIIDSIENSGRTWKAYIEDYNSGCSDTGDAYYVNKHNPFVYYTDISGSPTRCANIVDANPGTSGYLALPTRLLSDLNSTTAVSNYMWLSPNTCNDGHNICKPLNNTVSQSNQYLSLLVPKILNSTLFKTQHAALFITWDEAATSTTRTVTAILAGPMVKTGYKSTLPYSHYSMVRTIEAAWTLPTITAYDSTATPMTEFF
ncbi:MAG TPA: alkaline phosphatase family protein [Candidatus Angelobacter sp.]|nr:alkaline phosphatase family protein [Candidatus Angelobacter sp.]